MFQHPGDKDETCIPFLSAVSTSAFVNGRAVSLVLELLRQASFIVVVFTT